MSQSAATAAPASTPRSGAFGSVLETVLKCPGCGETTLRVDGSVRCTACPWTGHLTSGVPDFVDESRLSEGHHAEVAAQTNAVETYYENESKLTCHWDRMSSEDMPELLGPTSGLALDLGCGTGTAGSGLIKNGMRVIGADLSVSCLLAAQRRLDAVVRVDSVNLPFADTSFDAVVSRGALHHFADPHAALEECRRVMKPGARAVFMDPREYAWLEPIKHTLRRHDEAFTHEHHAYTPQEYRDLVGAHLEVERSFSWHPLAILVAHGIDLFPMPKAVPRRPLAKGLLQLDRLLNKTPLSTFGHLLVVVARKA